MLYEYLLKFHIVDNNFHAVIGQSNDLQVRYKILLYIKPVKLILY